MFFHRLNFLLMQATRLQVKDEEVIDATAKVFRKLGPICAQNFTYHAIEHCLKFTHFALLLIYYNIML